MINHTTTTRTSKKQLQKKRKLKIANRSQQIHITNDTLQHEKNNRNENIASPSLNNELQKEINEMRTRVELQLQSLIRGAEANQVHQQVTDLRIYTRTAAKETCESNDADDALLLLSSSSGNNLDSAPPIIDLTQPTTTKIQINDEVLPPQTVLEVINNEATCYVEKESILDPYGDKGIYTGELLVNLKKPHGLGTMIYDDGRIFTGSWNNGKWHGSGKCLYFLFLGLALLLRIFTPCLVKRDCIIRKW